MEHNTKQQLNTFVDWCRETFGRFVAWMEDRTDRDLNGAQAVVIAAAAHPPISPPW
ncbi:hypothetical protein [Amycolatopsis methanolica]|uniref:hypothetical protein n=1 Tax=Amycolatopsis methanolica TaxID=1814 RepID=UPI003426109C